MNANEAIEILNDCYDSEIGGYCGRSQEVAKLIQSLQAENERLRVIEEKARAVVKTYREWGNDALSFELDELEDALKGGAK